MNEYKTSFFDIELGLPTILTLWWFEKFYPEIRKNLFDILAIWYYTGHIRYQKYKFLSYYDKKKFQDFLNKDPEKIYPKLIVKTLFHLKEVENEIKSLMKVFEMIEEEELNTTPKDAIEILIGSLISKGMETEKIYGMTILELNMLNKSIKYQLSQIKKQL